MVLVDSSSWIESLRAQGRADVRERVAELLATGQAVWCDIIRLELWNGAAGFGQKKTLRNLERTLARLPIDDNVWQLAIELADRARESGVTLPADDLLILACARYYKVRIEHCDRHFSRIEQLLN